MRPLTIPAMPPGFPAIEAKVAEFRRLALVSILSGAIAGLVWFSVQYFAVVPLIQKAEVFEQANHQDHAEGASWHPENGGERNALTAAATVLTAIGLSVILFGIVQALGQTLDARRGLLWGLAGFLCVNAAPALGLPPAPPGVIQADLHPRQLWWAATVLLTAIGLWLIAGKRTRRWFHRLAGLIFIALPHLAGAPSATGQNLVPARLVTEFTWVSLFAAAVFWLTLGFSGGFFLNAFAKGEPAA
jgi:cobalt transporter subunit CbtA